MRKKEIIEKQLKKDIENKAPIVVRKTCQCSLFRRSSTVDKKNPETTLTHPVTFVEFHRNLLEKSRRRSETCGGKAQTRLNRSNDQA